LQRLRESAPTAPAAHAPSSVIIASDRDTRAVETAQRNAERAKLADAIHFGHATFGQGEIPPQPGLVVLNPPYGRRLGDRGYALRLGRDLGQTLLAKFAGWRAAVLCPDQTFVNAVAGGARKKPNQTYALRNGGLRVILGVWAL
jgi:23S rRNA G2445 N2-methylase RlmL